MDFVYVEDIARANILAATADVTDDVFNVASGVETSLAGLAEKLLEVMGSDLSVEFGPERAVNRCRAGWPTRAARASASASRPRSTSRRASPARRVVARRARAARFGPRSRRRRDADPVRTPVPHGRRGRGGRRRSIASGWVSQGPRVREFEQAFAERVGAPDAVATTNCTTALHLALYASGVGPGDEVIVPSLSFIATANSVWQCGATPVFADIDPLTYNLDPAAAEAAITPRTKAIMPVHQVGLPADMDPLPRARRAPRRRDRRGRRVRDRRDLQGPADRLARPAGLLLACTRAR